MNQASGHSAPLTRGLNKGYMLGRTASAMCRLNLQHYMWKDSFQFLLHPSIPMTPTSCVADIATGTGIWLSELARDYPSAQLDGFDLDITQASHPSWLPSNISLATWDIFIDPPAELYNRYDIVHVRLLVLVIPNKDPTPFIKRLMKLLKPGGYLQWDELNGSGISVKKVSDEISTPGLDRLREIGWAGGKNDWTLDIPAALEAEGFQQVAIHHFQDRDDMIRLAHEQHMMTFGEVALRMIEEGQEEAAAKFFEVTKLAAEEAKLGAALNIPRFVVVARKSDASKI